MPNAVLSPLPLTTLRPGLDNCTSSLLTQLRNQDAVAAAERKRQRNRLLSWLLPVSITGGDCAHVNVGLKDTDPNLSEDTTACCRAVFILLHIPLGYVLLNCVRRRKEAQAAALRRHHVGADGKRCRRHGMVVALRGCNQQASTRRRTCALINHCQPV